MIPKRQKWPRPSEIPPVEQEQLQELYRKFVSGIEDIELLGEVESRLIARAEIWLALHYDYRDCEEAWKEGKETPDQCADKVDAIADRYGMYELGGNADSIILGLDDINRNRRKQYSSRMLAIDRLVHALHDRGPFAGNFIDGPLLTDEFLDNLEAWRPPGVTPWRETEYGTFRYRRPNVRSYRRLK